MIPLSRSFYARDAQTVARDLLGKIIRYRFDGHWLAARIIETEAYYLAEKGSHASLGFTEKRRALFMESGTIYMYYARGGDSLNISAEGDGNAVLIKSGYAWFDEHTDPDALAIMRRNNPATRGPRSPERLCAGQTLLCKALGLKVPDWNARQFDPERFFVADGVDPPSKIIQTPRLGIPTGRDEHLMYRFVDAQYAAHCTKNPLRGNQGPVKILEAAGHSPVALRKRSRSAEEHPCGSPVARSTRRRVLQSSGTNTSLLPESTPTDSAGPAEP